MKAALINPQGIVENIIVWDENSSAPDGFEAIVLDDDFSISIGFIHERDQKFIDPVPIPVRENVPEPAPPSLSELQSQLITLQTQIEALASAQKATKPI